MIHDKEGRDGTLIGVAGRAAGDARWAVRNHRRRAGAGGQARGRGRGRVGGARVACFSLFAGAAARAVALTANRVECSIIYFGNQCTDVTGSGTVEGAFWPRGSGDNYVYNGGLQIGALIAPNAGFAWAGDTVGVFFMDPRGDQQQGDGLTGVYNSLNANDLAVWPTGAYTNDTTLFDPRLVGRQAISDQDTWTRYWDGNPVQSTGRYHMMGVVVDQRTLSWSRQIQQDIVYMLFRVINITSRLPSSYANLAAYGYSTADQQQLATLGARFQAAATTAYPSLVFPDSGYTFRNMYLAYFQDPDIGNASYNFSTAVLPFSLVAGLDYNYDDLTFLYPPDVFGAPFARAPGYEAIQFLHAPGDSTSGTRIREWSNTCSGCGDINDPIGTSQLYRYLSGYLTPSLGDGVCLPNGLMLHTCLAIQNYADTRYWASTGPTDLAPGHSVLVAIAMLYAAPLAQWAATSNGMYAMPVGQLSTYIGGANGSGSYTYRPGWPALPDTLAVVGTAGGGRVCTSNCTQAATIRDPVERPMGWGQFSDANGDGRIEMNEVQTAPGSLLRKAQVAQALFDHKFLLTGAPAAPRFFLVPGDSQVTVVWEKSATETTGEPYFTLASNPTSPLYDPDYRPFDVQGYRLWRGTSAADLKVIVEYDDTSATFTDYTGEVYDASHSQCAPELGLSAPPACAATFQVPYAGTGQSVTYGLFPPLIQIPQGGRVRLADGGVAVLRADTARYAGGLGPTNNVGYGVPFSVVDQGVRNGFTYVYAVSAFSVNSLASGPSVLESPLALETVTPRVPSVNSHPAAIVTGIFGDDGVALDPGAAQPTVDPATGAFSGLVPPTNAASLSFVNDMPEALGPGDITARIDSITPGLAGGIGTPNPEMFVTFSSPTDTVRSGISIVSPSYYQTSPQYPGYSGWGVSFSSYPPLVRFDSARAAALGLGALVRDNARMSVLFTGLTAPPSASDPGFTMLEQRYGWSGNTAADAHSAYLNHAVWYNEGSAYPSQATINPFGSKANTNGTLAGVDIIYQPIVYRQPPGNDATAGQVSLTQRYVEYSTPLYYPADFVVTWNADSGLTVRDSTHHVNLPFRPDASASWGFVNERAFTAAGIPASNLTANGADANGSPQLGVVGYHHEYSIAPMCDDYFLIPCAPLQRKAELEPVDYQNLGPATGNGIVLYIDGMFFVMQMSRLPAAGTRWHLKAVSGVLDATCATYFPTSPAAVAPCSSYSYAPLPYRPPYATGLQYKIRVTQAAGVTAGAGDLSRIHTVPDPYYNHSGYETAGGPRILRFVNLPAQCIIRIYSTSGILIRVLTHNDPTDGGEEPWDLTSRSGDLVASGVYFYHVEASDRRSRVGRMTIIDMTN